VDGVGWGAGAAGSRCTCLLCSAVPVALPRLQLDAPACNCSTLLPLSARLPQGGLADWARAEELSHVPSLCAFCIATKGASSSACSLPSCTAPCVRLRLI
jgi:hypothetical protein